MPVYCFLCGIFCHSVETRQMTGQCEKEHFVQKTDINVSFCSIFLVVLSLVYMLCLIQFTVHFTVYSG